MTEYQARAVSFVFPQDPWIVEQHYLLPHHPEDRAMFGQDFKTCRDDEARRSLFRDYGLYITNVYDRLGNLRPAESVFGRDDDDRLFLAEAHSLVDGRRHPFGDSYGQVHRLSFNGARRIERMHCLKQATRGRLFDREPSRAERQAMLVQNGQALRYLRTSQPVKSGVMLTAAYCY